MTRAMRVVVGSPARFGAWARRGAPTLLVPGVICFPLTLLAAQLTPSTLPALSTPSWPKEPGVEILHTDPVPESIQPALQQAAQAFARAWGAGSADQLAGLLAPSGIRLQLDGGSHGALSSRQALAALREFLRGFQGGTASVARAAPVDGSPDRGFAEIQWSARVAGTSEVLRRNVFVGMRLESQGWRVDEVRLLR